MAITVRIREETREKLRIIASAKRWTLSEAADAAADNLIEREGIKSQRTTRRSSPKQRKPAHSAA